ncbi:MAG: hypothetical protein WCH10_04770 [bacterium]
MKKLTWSEILLWVFIGLAFLLSIRFFAIGWSYPIVDFHAFRQTQTALTCFWMLKEGHYFTYHTPVLGYPWSIPLEFPLYQWLVVITHKLTSLMLEQCGRLVSVIFFYFTLLPTYILLKNLNFKIIVFKIFACLFLLSPFYLFWARTFMIESLALFLAISFLAATQAYLNRSQVLTAIICIVFGGFSALTKITTFVPAMFFCFGLCLIDWYKKYNFVVNKKIIRKYAICILFILVPIFVGFIWVGYTDSIKVNHPVAHFLTSQALMSWNFGTLLQRVSLYLWQRVIFIDSLLVESLGFYVLFIILAVYLYVWKKCGFNIEDRVAIGFALFCFAIYFSIFFIFTNLYIEHNYYRCANTLYLILAAAIVLYVISKKLPSAFFMIVLLIIMIIQVVTYTRTYMLVAAQRVYRDKNYR